jgi:dTDP-glucose 4,6-dehydratase
MTFLVTGGCGFVGSHFTDLLISRGHRVVVADKLTYAGNKANLNPAADFAHGDICNRRFVRDLLNDQKPQAIFNFAAESHVCRSIAEPRAFLDSNVCGTYFLLQESVTYWRGNPDFRYVQISTDEVFGDLGPNDQPFTEDSPYRPNSPYAATKAAADHLVRSWSHTYGLPTIITHCSNNYGSRQHTEKLIPKLIGQAVRGEPLTIHGDGSNVRDWIHVEDHCLGVLAAYEHGAPGSYCFGGNAERTNLEIANLIAGVIGCKGKEAITFVPDRPGNDRRYAIDFTKATSVLGWKPQWKFEAGLVATIGHYEELAK